MKRVCLEISSYGAQFSCSFLNQKSIVKGIWFKQSPEKRCSSIVLRNEQENVWHVFFDFVHLRGNRTEHFEFRQKCSNFRRCSAAFDNILSLALLSRLWHAVEFSWLLTLLAWRPKSLDTFATRASVVLLAHSVLARSNDGKDAKKSANKSSCSSIACVDRSSKV